MYEGSDKEEQDELEIGTGSFIKFFKNGKLMENNFENIFEGTYFAGISLYMHAQCIVNFGSAPFKY